MGPRLSGYSAVNVEDLTTVELCSRRLAVWHLEVYRSSAPGFANAFLMLGAPQIGVRHSRWLEGLRKVTRQQWDTGHVWPDEIGVSTSLSPSFPNISIPYGALIPTDLDNILGAGRHIACDASSPARRSRSAGSPDKLRGSMRRWRPRGAHGPGTSMPARSNVSCCVRVRICLRRSRRP